MASYDYIRDPAKIYEKSFSIVEQEADLARLPTNMRPIATRLIHSCGMTDIVEDLAFTKNAVSAGANALRNGKSVLVDVEMVRDGIIRRLLPAANEIICTLNDQRTASHAQKIGNTRSAAGVDLWENEFDGAIAVIGNAPTALFRLLEKIEETAIKPALVIGIPVGFVGAVESKLALSENKLGLEYITVHGRRGGSAMASGILNGIAGSIS